MNLFELVLTGDHSALWSYVASSACTQAELTRYLPVLLRKAQQGLCPDPNVLSVLYSQPASHIILSLLNVPLVAPQGAPSLGGDVGSQFEHGSPEVKLQLTMDTLRVFISAPGSQPLEIFDDPYLRYGASLCLWVILSSSSDVKFPLHKVLGLLGQDIVMAIVCNSPSMFVACVEAATLAQNRALLVELSSLAPPWSCCRVRDELARRKTLPDLVVQMCVQLEDLALFLDSQRGSAWLAGRLDSEMICGAPHSTLSLWVLCAACWEVQFSPQEIDTVISKGTGTQPLQTICFILTCAGLLDNVKHSDLSECIRTLAQGDHAAELLLVALRFGVRKKIDKVVQFLHKSVGVKVRLDTTSFNGIGQFIADVLPLSDVSRLAQAHGSVECIVELLQNRVFQTHKISVLDSVCQTLASLTLPVPDMDCALLEEFCAASTAPIGYRQPMLAEQQLAELSDAGASVATRCGLLYIMLLHNKLASKSVAPMYAEKWIQVLPAKLLLLHLLSQKITGGLAHKLLGLVVTFLPNVVAADDLPIHRNPLRPGVVRAPLMELIEQPALGRFLGRLPAPEHPEEFSCTWEQLFYQFPTRVLGPTVAVLTHPPVSPLQLSQDPLLLIKRALPAVFPSPFVVRILTRLYHAVIGASRRSLSEANQLELKLAQDVAAARSLIKVLDKSPDIPLQSQQYICDTIHQIFLDTPEALQIVHLQGYSTGVIPLMCDLCPSLHLCIELVPELFSRNRLFSLTLGAHLSAKYPTRRSETLCANVVNSLAQSVAQSPHENHQLLLDASPALNLMAETFPLLREMISQINQN